MEPWTILSLFDFTGNWSRPYREAGYPVLQMDQKHGDELRTFDFTRIPRGSVRGILIAVPCTEFAVSGAQYWRQKDADGRTAAAVALVRCALSIVHHHRPRWWALENPVGRLNKLVPELQPHGPWYWNPCDFGDPYTKKTGLWGTFNRDLPRTPVEPVRSSAQGSWVQCLGGKSERTKELRSITPMGFARAFFQANP